MTTNETVIYQHTTSGELFAVVIDTFGRVVQAAGPLHHTEIEQARSGDFDSDQALADDIGFDCASYHVYED